MRKYRNYIVGFFVVVVLMFFALTGSAFAAIPTTFSSKSQGDALVNVRNKVIYTLISDCYESLTSPITIDSGYTTWKELFNNGNAKYNIPYYLFDDAKVKSTREMTCAEIMGGWKNFLGTQGGPGLGYKEKDIPVVDENGNFFGSKEEMILFLTEKLNYKPSADAQKEVDGRRCVFYQGSTENGKRYATDKLCAKQSVDDENKIDLKYGITREDVSSDDLGSGNLDTVIFKIKEVSYDKGMNINNKKTNVLAIPFVGYNTWVFTGGKWAPSANHASADNYAGCSDLYLQSSLLFWSNPDGVTFRWCYPRGFMKQPGKFRVEGVSEMTFEDLADALGAAILTAKNNEPSNFPGIEQMNHLSGDVHIEPALATVLEKCTREEYMTYFLGADYESFSRSLTETEKYVLYQKGLKSGENSLTESGVADGKGNVKYWLVGEKFYGPNKYNLTCSSDCKVATLVGDKIELLQKIEGSTPTILKLINALDFESEDFGEVEAPVEDLYPNVVKPIDKESSQACYNGAGPLGWILCPIIEGITGFGTVLWNDVEQNHLKTPAKEIFADGGGVEDVWNRIRDIGNIVFVILFLIVIFSQLTGVGIDNYGIKKILPKLILVAVLTNLSWIMCELAVDLSNIVGSGINSLLTGMAPNVTIVADTGSAPATAAVVDLALASGGIALFAWLNPIGLVSAAFAVLGMVLSILAGIAVMYVVLLIREAGIVLLVCLAPVAIVGYALPNTEKLSKKWFSLFKALLVVYPICGLVMGGGKLAGAVLASVNSESTGMKLAAMIIQVLPFFLIPMILKKSLSLMGNVGARVSQMGRGLSRRTSGMIQSGVRNSEKFKNFANFEQNRRTLRRANRIQKRFEGRDAKSLSKREQQLAAWANKTAASLENQQKRDEMMADSEMGYTSEVNYGTAALSNEREKKYSETFANMTDRSMVEKAFKDAVSGNDKEKASAAFKELLNQGGIEQAMDILSEDSVWDKMKASGVDTRIIQAMGSSKVDAFKAYNKYRSSGGTAAFKDWYKGTLSKEQLEKDKARGVKNQTYAEHLMRKDNDSMVNFDKDEIKYMKKNAPIAGELGDRKFDSDVYNRMVAQLMLKSSDAEARTTASEIIKNGIMSGGENFLANAGFTTGSFEKMRGRDAEMIVNAYTEKHGGNREAALSDIRGQFSTQIANAKNDPGALRNMDKEVLDMLGLKKEGNNTNASSANGENGVLRVGGNTNANGTNVNADANANVRARGANANSAARRSGIIEDSNYREYNIRRVEPVAPAPQSYSDVLPRIQGKTYEDVKTSDALPTWVQNEKDYQQLMVGAEASKVLTEINGKSFEEVKDSGVLPTSVNDEQGYKNYVRELGAQVQDTSNLKQYRVAQSKTYEQARDSGDAPAWVQDAQDYDRFVAGAEAKAMLPKIKDKTYEQARDSGVLPDGINSDNEFEKYSSELRIKAQDADSIRQYRAIEGKTYEQARDSGALPSGIGRAEYEQFSREYKKQFDEARKRGGANSVKPVNGQGNRPRQDDDHPSGDFIVPRQ